VALCQARSSTKPLWGFSSSNPYHSQSRAEQREIFSMAKLLIPILLAQLSFSKLLKDYLRAAEKK
jgi:hypothetical protein